MSNYVTRKDMVRIVEGLTNDFSEAMTYVVAVLAKQSSEPDAVVLDLEELAVLPALNEKPVVKAMVWKIARNLRGWQYTKR